MQKTAHRFTESEAGIDVRQIERYGKGWLLDGEYRQLSPHTVAARKSLLDKLVWFLRYNELPGCGTPEIRAFLAYMGRGHEDEGGRWGNPRMTRPVRPRTVQTHFINLKTFFRFLIDEGVIESSPIEHLRPPVARADQVQPFTQEQVTSLLQMAKRSTHPRRDEAILLFLLDTGVRASELCGLKMEDVDMAGRRCIVLGKGNKHRSVFFGRNTAKALWQYLREESREPDEPLFMADRGIRAGEPLTRSGLLQLIRRLARAAKIEAAQCSPHTFRHTFAVEFLRAGGNTFSLMQLLGHTSLHMTNRYVSLAQGDLEAQHRQFSPADRLKGRSR